jgi:hypothetical protein
MTVSDLLEQPCNKPDNIKQGCYKLLTACSKLVDNLGQAVRRQLVDGLLTNLLQDVRFLRVIAHDFGVLMSSLIYVPKSCNMLMSMLVSI